MCIEANTVSGTAQSRYLIIYASGEAMVLHSRLILGFKYCQWFIDLPNVPRVHQVNGGLIFFIRLVG